MAKQKFTVILLPDEDGYQVVFPHYPDCITWGATIDLALQNAREAIELHLEGLAGLGADPVPDYVHAPHVVVGTLDIGVPGNLVESNLSITKTTGS